MNIPSESMLKRSAAFLIMALVAVPTVADGPPTRGEWEAAKFPTAAREILASPRGTLTIAVGYE